MKTRFTVYNKEATSVVREGFEVSEGLSAEPIVIPRDGVSFALVHWAGFETTANWNVNGLVVTEPAVPDESTGLWTSELEVVSNFAGPIKVTCNGLTVELEAV